MKDRKKNLEYISQAGLSYPMDRLGNIIHEEDTSWVDESQDFMMEKRWQEKQQRESDDFRRQTEARRKHPPEPECPNGYKVIHYDGSIVAPIESGLWYDSHNNTWKPCKDLFANSPQLFMCTLCAPIDVNLWPSEEVRVVVPKGYRIAREISSRTPFIAIKDDLIFKCNGDYSKNRYEWNWVRFGSNCLL